MHCCLQPCLEQSCCDIACLYGPIARSDLRLRHTTKAMRPIAAAQLIAGLLLGPTLCTTDARRRGTHCVLADLVLVQHFPCAVAVPNLLKILGGVLACKQPRQRRALAPGSSEHGKAAREQSGHAQAPRRT
jgi:hypothetical protein